MKQVPKGLQQLVQMVGSDEVSPDALRETLRGHDKEQLVRNGFHLIQASLGNTTMLVQVMKFAVVHEALGSDPSVLWCPLSSRLLGNDGEQRSLTDDDAVPFVTYLLDQLKVKTFPGLIYQACRFGMPMCAQLLKERGIYAPLAWRGYASDTEEDRVRVATLLVQVVQPSEDDLAIIGKGFERGTLAAQVIDQAMEQQRTRG